MKAFAIIGAIVCAWISGVGASESGNGPATLGALVLLVISVMFGLWAWSL